MAEVSTINKSRVARAIYDAQLLKFGDFELKSGDLSPFYLDLRKAQSHPIAFRAIVDSYAQMLEDIDHTIPVAGIPEAATPFAGAIGYSTHRPLLQPRKIIKEHGTKRSVEGEFEAGDSVVLLDDLISQGDSKLEAIEQIEHAGLVVEKFVVLIDRQQGGLEMIQRAGYDIQAGLSISALVETLRTERLITENQKDTVIDYIHGD